MASQGLFPIKSPGIPDEVGLHLQQIYLKVNQQAQAILAIHGRMSGTNTTTVEQIVSGGGAGGANPISALGSVNNQTGQTAYTTQTTDNGALLILDDASPVAVTLNSGVSSPFFLFISNYGAGAVTLTPSMGTLTGISVLQQNFFCLANFDGSGWWTSAELLPQTATPVTGEYLTGYDSSTGAFSQSTPAGLSVTITTAALTTLGTQGSMTFVGGLLTAQTPAT